MGCFPNAKHGAAQLLVRDIAGIVEKQETNHRVARIIWIILKSS